MEKFICIIDPYSDIPEVGLRLGRYHQIASHLVSSGYRVRIYISNISHRDKSKTISTGYNNTFNGVEYFIAKGFQYKTHISFARILHEKLFIKNVIRDLKINAKPDLILIREPAVFISNQILKYINKYKIKYIVDIIDLWPELFELVLPDFLSKYSDLIFSYLYKRRKNLFNNASGYTAVSPDYLQIATEFNFTKPSDVIFWGSDLKKFHDLMLKDNGEILIELSISKKSNEFWVIYSGTLGDNYDIKNIFEVASELKSHPSIKFLIAGSGPLEQWINDYLKLHQPDNIYFLGLLKTDRLIALYKYCDLGLTSYVKKSTVSMPIKAYDYFAASLPIVNSLEKHLGFIVEKFGLGYNYNAEDKNTLKHSILLAYNDKQDFKNKINNVKKISLEFEQKNQYQKIIMIVNRVLSDKNL